MRAVYLCIWLPVCVRLVWPSRFCQSLICSRTASSTGELGALGPSGRGFAGAQSDFAPARPHAGRCKLAEGGLGLQAWRWKLRGPSRRRRKKDNMQIHSSATSAQSQSPFVPSDWRRRLGAPCSNLLELPPACWAPSWRPGPPLGARK